MAKSLEQPPSASSGASQKTRIPRLDPEPVTFDPETHRYLDQTTQEVMAHSVTKVTGHGMSAFKRRNIDRTKSVWEPRGLACHLAMHHHATGQPVEMGDYVDWIEPLLEHKFWREFDLVASEFSMVDPTRSLGGQLDLLGYWKGKLTVVDLKTQQEAEASTYRTHAQLGGYVSLLNYTHPHLFIEQCRTLWARPGVCFLGKEQPTEECDVSWADAWDNFIKDTNANSF